MVYTVDQRAVADKLKLKADSLLALAEEQNIQLQIQKAQLDSTASATKKEKELLTQLYNSKVEVENNPANIN